MIRLFDGWVIRADDSGYSLSQAKMVVDKKTGEPYESYQNARYYGTIEQCANSLCRTLQRNAVSERDYNASEALKVLNEIRETVRTAFAGIDSAKENGND